MTRFYSALVDSISDGTLYYEVYRNYEGDIPEGVDSPYELLYEGDSYEEALAAYKKAVAEGQVARMGRADRRYAYRIQLQQFELDADDEVLAEETMFTSDLLH